jgi:hypothetical protein
MSIGLFGGKGSRRKSLEKLRCRFEDNIKVDLREIEFGNIDSREDRDYRQALVSAMMKLWVIEAVGGRRIEARTT